MIQTWTKTNNQVIDSSLRVMARSCAQKIFNNLMKGGHYMTYMQNLYAQTVENARANRAQEQLKAAEIQEAQRSHLVNEALSKRDLEEKIRHQITQDTETMRHNMVSEDEIRRHNEVTEQLENRRNSITELSARLNYMVQHERNINEKQIAEMNNATKLYLDSAQLRINEMNSKSQRQQATAALMAAKGRIDAGEASLRNAAVNEDLAASEKFSNYSSGLRDISSAVKNVADVVDKFLPTSGSSKANSGGAQSYSEVARNIGKSNAKSTGKTAKDIINNSRRDSK